MSYSEQSLHEAIGWVSAAMGGPALAVQAHRANKAGLHEVAGHLLRWADHSASSLRMLDFADRRRHWDADREVILSLVLDQEDD